MIGINKYGKTNYTFVLKSKSGQILLESTPFTSEKEAQDAAMGLPDLIKKPNVFERKTNHNGQFLFNLKNATGKPLGSSQLYNSEAGMENGIKNTIALATAISTTQ